MPAKKDKKLTIDYWHEKNVSISELAQVHRALAKRTNQRLVRLERSASMITGEKYDTYGAADIAKKYLAEKNRTRFQEFQKRKGEIVLPKELQKLSTNAQRNRLIKDINEMQKFLLSKSSTVSGQREIEKKRIKTFERAKYSQDGIQRQPLSIETATNKQFYEFLNSQTFSDLTTVNRFDSNTIVEIYDEARTVLDMPVEEIEKAFSEYSEKQNQSEKGLRKYLGLKPIID